MFLGWNAARDMNLPLGEGLEAQHGKADSSCVSRGTEMSRPKLSKYSRTAGVLNLRRNASDRRKTHAFFFGGVEFPQGCQAIADTWRCPAG